MAQCKCPLFSLRAQGVVGWIYYSTHSGRNYAYKKAPLVLKEPSARQKQIQADFKKGAATWRDLDENSHAIIRWLAQNERKYYSKDCKPSRWYAYLKWMQIWLRDMPPGVKELGLVGIIAWLAWKFAWVAILLFP